MRHSYRTLLVCCIIIATSVILYYQLDSFQISVNSVLNISADEKPALDTDNDQSFINDDEGNFVKFSQGSMECGRYNFTGEGSDTISNIAYWKEIPYDYDMPKELQEMRKIGPNPKYLIFQRDGAGWNNIRLGYECMILLALLTGRTLVMPPKGTMDHQNSNDERMKYFLEDFMPVKKLSKVTGLEIISMEEFFKREQNLTEISFKKLNLLATSELSPPKIDFLLTDMVSNFNYSVATIDPRKKGLIFPYEPGSIINMEDIRYKNHSTIKYWLDGREITQYDENLQQVPFLYWTAKDPTRLLIPFYTFTRHSNESIDRYLKRILRDYVHYNDEVFCKASQVLSLLKMEAFNGTFSSFHVRRGDFYVEREKTTAEEMLAATEPYIREGETVYIATDERNKTFFSPLQNIYDLKFLDDYWERASMDDISNPNFIAMIDGIVASHGRTFTGTWLSTYTAYILRMRGHLGHPRTSNWNFKKHVKNFAQIEQWPMNPFWMTGSY